MTLLGLTALAWLAGLLVYVSALRVMWGESLDGGDLRAVVFWSACASVAATVFVYRPIMAALHRRVRRGHRWVVLPALGCCLGVCPALLIVAMFGGAVGAALSPEAVLFYAMFGGFGLVFGSGYVLLHRQRG